MLLKRCKTISILDASETSEASAANHSEVIYHKALEDNREMRHTILGMLWLLDAGQLQQGALTESQSKVWL